VSVNNCSPSSTPPWLFPAAGAAAAAVPCNHQEQAVLCRATAADSSSNPVKDRKQLKYKRTSSSRTNSFTCQSTQHKTVMSRVVAAQDKVLELRDVVTIEHYAVD